MRRHKIDSRKEVQDLRRLLSEDEFRGDHTYNGPLGSFMGRWTSESSGLNVMQRLASEKIKDPQVRNRIWCPTTESWGFFHDDEKEPMTEIDEFLIWCSIKQGDRMQVYDENLGKTYAVILRVWEERVEEISYVKLSLVDYRCVPFEMWREESKLFAIAWKLL